MARRAGLVVLGVLVLAFGAGLAAVLVFRGPECPVRLDEVDRDAGELVPVADLAPEGSVGEERQPVIDAIGALGAPFGEVVAGRFYAEGTAPPVLVPFGEDVVLATAGAPAPSGGAGDFLAVDVPDGSVRWGKGYDGGPAHGGLVDDAFVVLVGGRSPSLVALDAGDGNVLACVAAPAAGGSGASTTLLTDQAGTDVVVAAGPPAAPVTLSRITPSEGEVAWRQELTGLVEAGSVTVAGDTAVVGRIGSDPVRLADMAAAGGIGAPMVTAYSLDDGAERWAYPASEEYASTSALVVGSEAGSDSVVALTASPGRTGTSKATVARLVGLDAGGAERWGTRLGPGFWSASLWGDLVVAQGAGRSGGAQLRAFSAADGRFRWSIDSARLPSSGEQPRTNFGSGTAVGDDYLVPAPNGLLLVDPATGGIERLDSRVAVEQVLPAGDHLLVRTREALLVVGTV